MKNIDRLTDRENITIHKEDSNIQLIYVIIF